MPGSTCWTATGVRCSPARTTRTPSWRAIPGTEYAAWHLGLTVGATDETKARYAFVYGDLRRVHRTALIACVYRASEWRHKEVELAAHDLLQHLDHLRLRDYASTQPKPQSVTPGCSDVPSELVRAVEAHRPVERVGSCHQRVRRDHHLAHAVLAGPLQAGLDQRPADTPPAAGRQRPPASGTRAWSLARASSATATRRGHQVTVPSSSTSARRPPPPTARPPGLAARRRQLRLVARSRPVSGESQQIVGVIALGGDRAASAYSVGPGQAYEQAHTSNSPTKPDPALGSSNRPSPPDTSAPSTWMLSGARAVQHQNETLPGELGVAVACHLAPAARPCARPGPTSKVVR